MKQVLIIGKWIGGKRIGMENGGED